jgi:protein-S-isoprenylcysteine O-methyltransferase Ste14
LRRRTKPRPDSLLSAAFRVLVAGAIVALATADLLHAWALLAGAVLALGQAGVRRWWSRTTGQEWTPVPPNESVIHRLRTAGKEHSPPLR